MFMSASTDLIFMTFLSTSYNHSMAFGTTTRSITRKKKGIEEVQLKSSPTKYATQEASPRRDRWQKAPFRQSPSGGPSFFDLYSNVSGQQPQNLGIVTTGCTGTKSKVPATLGQYDEDITTRELGVAEAEVLFGSLAMLYKWKLSSS